MKYPSFFILKSMICCGLMLEKNKIINFNLKGTTLKRFPMKEQLFFLAKKPSIHTHFYKKKLKEIQNINKAHSVHYTGEINE